MNITFQFANFVNTNCDEFLLYKRSMDGFWNVILYFQLKITKEFYDASYDVDTTLYKYLSHLINLVLTICDSYKYKHPYIPIKTCAHRTGNRT